MNFFIFIFIFLGCQNYSILFAQVMFKYRSKSKPQLKSFCCHRQIEQRVLQYTKSPQNYENLYYQRYKQQRRKYKSLKKELMLMKQYVTELEKSVNNNQNYLNISNIKQYNYITRISTDSNDYQLNQKRQYGKFRKVQNKQQHSIDTKDTPDTQYLSQMINQTRKKDHKDKKKKMKIKYNDFSDYFH